MEEKRYLQMRFYDIIHGKAAEKEKSAEEIIADLRRRLEEDDG